MRRKRSAIEAAINGLEVHGFDKFLHHGIKGFKRYYCAICIIITPMDELRHLADRCYKCQDSIGQPSIAINCIVYQ